MTTSQFDQQVRIRLAAHNVRYTSGRQRVLAVLARAEGPRSAAELHAELEQAIPLSSLYRSLSVMADADVLSPHHSVRGITRFELAEWLMGHHHHLICIECGRVDDIELSPDVERTLESIVSRVAEDATFSASGHQLEIDGRCARCT